MIKRIWHGWTSLENADPYQQLLNQSIFPGIEAKKIPGYISIELLRRQHDSEVEFIVIMAFDSLQNVIDFQGEDYSKAYIPEEAKTVLSRWDDYASHYEVIETRTYKLSNP